MLLVLAPSLKDLAAAGQQQEIPPPTDPPEDGELHRAIESLAPYMARLGPAMQALAAKRLATRPAYSFLDAGPGSAFFR